MTKMTLTQVSTWFANARRRLKKENKMTWSPRNRCGEKKEGGEDEDTVSESDAEHSGSEEEKLCDEKEENITIFKETLDKDERKENMPSNTMDISEQPKTTTESSPNRTANPVVQFQALRAVQCVTSGDPEDSPVKSLRKWVDGCFHNTPVSLVKTSPSPCETPPSTPTQNLSTEASVIIQVRNSTPSQTETEKKEIESEPPHRTRPSKEEPITLERKEETARGFNTVSKSITVETSNYREIDAALALTTLSAR